MVRSLLFAGLLSVQGIASIPVVFAQAPAAQAPAAQAPAARADAQDPITVTTRITPEQPRVGDLITYQINVAYPQGYAVNLPRQLDLQPLELVETKEGPEASSGQGLVRQFTLVLQAFSLDQARVPAVELTYVDAQAQVHTKRVPAQTIEMRSLTANEAEPTRHGEDPMVSPEYENRKAELMIYAILAGVLLAALAYAAWRWLAPKKDLRAPVVVIPAHQQATQRLDRLEEGLAQRFKDGAGVLVYLELTEIAKGYLGSRYQVECLDRTTFELEQDLKETPELFGPVSGDQVRTFLRNCDLVKFARVATDVEDAKAQLLEVRSWIDCSETSQAPAAQAGEGAQAEAQ